MQVSGNFVGTVLGEQPYGTVQSYSGYEGVYSPLGVYPTYCGAPSDYNSNNYYWVCYGEAPAYWTITYTLNYYCGSTNLIYEDPFNIYEYQLTHQETFPTSGIQGDCITKDVPSASTRFAILGQLPETLTLTGEASFVTTYGMPELYVYDGTATLVATETATSVSSDGSQATFPFPSSLQQNAYTVAVANQTGGSPGTSAVGTNYLSVASSQTISGSPFGVSVGAQTTETINCVYVEEGNPPHQTTQCTTSSSNPDTIPVVSLYSANQVMIGSTLVNVGANPTAVGTYAVSPVTSTTSNGSGYVTTILSGSLRAIVANSGSNTVTILNTVTDTSVATVTVGNQPVALTVSSTGAYAYVANYTDSTITRVNLSTNTAAGTVVVGGHPTSVALTSGGTLWVGGVGFLTEINTSTMTATATEAISGKTIVGLGYSDSVGQIVATTVDSSNNVYIDQIAPSSVTSGGTYTTVASNQISSVGTHLNVHTEAQVRSFTNTLASQSILNTNQPGAPPLVVQDGWAVVTATPTGFSITDITGNVVLVSEQTPSPITAIAIDPNLNVVYLTMPDSNTLLKVPLPGTN